MVKDCISSVIKPQIIPILTFSFCIIIICIYSYSDNDTITIQNKITKKNYYDLYLLSLHTVFVASVTSIIQIIICDYVFLSCKTSVKF